MRHSGGKDCKVGDEVERLIEGLCLLACLLACLVETVRDSRQIIPTGINIGRTPSCLSGNLPRLVEMPPPNEGGLCGSKFPLRMLAGHRTVSRGSR